MVTFLLFALGLTSALSAIALYFTQKRIDYLDERIVELETKVKKNGNLKN